MHRNPSTSRRNWALLLLGGIAALFALGANCEAPALSRCTSDLDCQSSSAYLFCEVETGLCLCNDNRGCGDNEVCNGQGRCQAFSGCNSNADCCLDDECEGLFCDVRTNQCLSVDECQPDEGEYCCTLDSQCPFGFICNTLDLRCTPGCRDDGDCLLGQGCVGGGLGGQIGQCESGVCTANNLCACGEVCNLEEGECVFDDRGPYCSGCTGGVASDDCGEPANYCLTDTSDPSGSSSFCGVDCSQQQSCPFGFTCNEVIIIPPAAPFCAPPERCIKDNPEDASGYCSRNTMSSCSVDDDCPEGGPGSDCPRAQVGNCLLDQTQSCSEDYECCDDAAACPPGSCVRQECVGGEGDQFGFCTCTRDLDCPRDECVGADLSDPNNVVTGNCRLSGHRCFENIDCDVIACIRGGCRIGANCAPGNDRTCAEIVAGQQP